MKKLTKLDSTKGFYPKVKGKKRRLAEMLVDPEIKLNITQICEKVGISRATFYNWQQDSDFNDYVNFLIDSYTDSELANVWKALIKRACNGSVDAQKLYFELKNKYKQDIGISAKINETVTFVEDLRNE